MKHRNRYAKWLLFAALTIPVPACGDDSTDPPADPTGSGGSGGGATTGTGGSGAGTTTGSGSGGGGAGGSGAGTTTGSGGGGGEGGSGAGTATGGGGGEGGSGAGTTTGSGGGGGEGGSGAGTTTGGGGGEGGSGAGTATGTGGGEGGSGAGTTTGTGGAGGESAGTTTGTGGGGGAGGESASVEWPTVTSEIPLDPEIEDAIAELLAQMSPAQKVGQMVQPEILAITPDQVREYHIGSVLNGGGSWPGRSKHATVADWVALADAYYAASTDTSGAPGEHLGIPVIWGVDAVHGHNNVIGATLFPQNIGLGAMNDPDLIEEIGSITATEVAVTGLDWAFAPTLAVVRDDRWGRSYEGYSEDPEIVKSYAGRMIRGLQGRPADSADLFSGRHVIATAKHFMGDGGTEQGKDQGNTVCSEEDLRDIHAQGYLSALEAGAQTVMASFSSWNGDKMHGHRYLLTDILKGQLGFTGFVIGDWNGHGQLPGCNNSQCAAAINAGVDMIMVPNDWRAFIENTIAEVQSGEIPMARVDDAVTRILRVKMRAGLFGPKANKGAPSARSVAGDATLLAAPEHRAVAREAVRKSLVLLKNKGDVLPLSKSMNVLVAGKTADNIQNQSGGWTLTWQGTGNTNADFPNAQSIYAGIDEAIAGAGMSGSATLSPDGTAAADTFDAAIVVIGETPYAEGQGDIGKFETLEHANLNPEDLAVIDTIRAQAPSVPIVTVFVSGRPLHTNKELNRSDAFVAAWLPGSEGGGVADVLFGDYEFQGKLSFSWPSADCQAPINKGDGETPLFPYGYGLVTTDADVLDDDLPEVSTGHGCAAPDPGEAGTTNEPLEIFVDGDEKGDYVLRIGGPSNWGGIDVGMGATLPGGEVSVSTVDGEIQGSAKQVTWSATGQIYAQVSAGMPGVDLSPYYNSETSIVFRARVDAPPEGTLVTLSAHCVYPCFGDINIASTLTSIADGEWHEVSVPLKCLTDKGLDITNVNTPFLIYSESPMDVAIEDVRWEPFTAGPTPTCAF
ncbi:MULTISPECIES: exo 1,3/1,4-beta-D-glucan glucohydrolase [Sorangium]|uniref:Glycoside hydrolase n=1 Tax=Sorangium cellulosum TaxID=56 RepID=A0A4P2R1M4_SORCE|nr:MULTISPECIES: exo 1,3/1,4-beta-D-glucan glucohydrolase [Sorangium]AUX36765.1 glycoside hydrolase [Sorangium cellulosum]WCQ96063.1 Beta-hexosaminidase [Sorangium sp. Soce836]